MQALATGRAPLIALEWPAPLSPPLGLSSHLLGSARPYPHYRVPAAEIVLCLDVGQCSVPHHFLTAAFPGLSGPLHLQIALVLGGSCGGKGACLDKGWGVQNACPGSTGTRSVKLSELCHFP